MNRLRPCRAAVILTLLAACPATIEAAAWKKEPQPLLAAVSRQSERFPVTADPGSNLAFDSGWKILWSVGGGRLTGYIWNRDKFFQPLMALPQDPAMSGVADGSAIVVDARWHLTYFISPDEKLRVMQKSPFGWLITDTISAPVTQVLGVHPDWHTVFAYDAGSRSLLAVHWSATEATWKSSVIATGLGNMIAEGVVDAKRHVFYATAQDAPSLGVSGAAEKILQPWPLIATWWNGTAWNSQVITQTGVAQRPAYIPKEDRVYYAQRGDVDGLRWFRPSQGKLTPGDRTSIPDLLTQGTLRGSSPPAFGERIRWQGADSWVDDKRYRVNLTPSYSTGASLSGSVISIGSGASFSGSISIDGGTLGFTNTLVSHSGVNATDWANGLVGYHGVSFIGSGWDNANGFLTISGVTATIDKPRPADEAPPHRLAGSYLPAWETPEVAQAGLRELRSLYSPKRGEIVQQRVSEDPWSLTVSKSWQYVPGVYQATYGGYYRLGPGVVTSVRKHYVDRVTTTSYAEWSAVHGPIPIPAAPVNGTILDFNPTAAGLQFLPTGNYFTLGGAGTFVRLPNIQLAGGEGLIKTGTGTLTLNPATTYGGTATVTTGTLRLTAPGTAASLDLNLSTGGGLDLAFEGTHTINRLRIDGALQESGEWGGLASGAVHNTALITGAGTLTVLQGCGTVTVTNPPDTTGVVGSAFNATFVADGAAGTLNWFLESGALPPGLTFSIGGTLYGTPTEAGTFPITVKVVDSNSCSAVSSTYTLLVSPSGVDPASSSLETVAVHEWVEVPNPDAPPVITVDGVSYYDPSHAQTVTSVPASLVKPLEELLGKGAIESDAASLPAPPADYQFGSAKVRTFGHRIADSIPRAPAPGGRYRYYPQSANSTAMAGGIACDANSTMVFYVQAPDSTGGPAWVVVVD